MAADRTSTGATGWNDPMMKQIRKTLAAATVIIGSSVIAMLLFGTERDGGSALGTATRSLKKLAYLIGDTNAVIAGVIVLLAVFIGLVFWIRGR
jgi:hypothetical protein